jgi:hypothetical protein
MVAPQVALRRHAPLDTEWLKQLSAWARPALLLVTLARCSGCEDGNTTEVRPVEVLTAPSVKLALLARARDSFGLVIDPTPTADWNGDAMFDPTNANPRILWVTTVGDHKVKAKIGKHWSPAAVIRAAQSSLESPGDVVDVEHGSGAAPVDVLLDARAQGDVDCSSANDRRYTMAGPAVLPQNLIGGCNNEIAVFAHDRAPLIESLSTTAWTNGPETLQRPILPAVIAVPTIVWYFVEAEDPVPRATWDLEYANWAHAYNRAGIRLDPIEHRVMGREETYVGDENCTAIETALQFTADPGHLHVVYVGEIGWVSEPYGWSCPADAARGDVVLISWKRPLATVVTHEVVHRMGNSHPPFPFVTSGHVDSYPGFDGTNLMWSHDDPTLNEDRFSLTLGQIYRVHGAIHSWVNRAKLRPAGATEKDCPGDPTGDICPKLELRGWIP